MAIRKILTIDQPVLRTKAKKVSRFDNYLERLVSDMWETMREAPGVGLAAPQIGQSIRVLVAEYEENAVALVNPEILKRSDEIEYGTEGCLSIPGLVGDDVPRHAAITVKGRDPKGKEIRVKADGWWARVLQHEIDHLDGILYTDHIPPEKVRKVEPDEIADEAEVRHTGVNETVAGESVPIRRGAPATPKHADSGGIGNPNDATNADSGRIGNRQHPATVSDSGRIGNRERNANPNSGRIGNPDNSSTPNSGRIGNRQSAATASDSGKNGNLQDAESANSGRIGNQDDVAAPHSGRIGNSSGSPLRARRGAGGEVPHPAGERA